MEITVEASTSMTNNLETTFRVEFMDQDTVAYEFILYKCYVLDSGVDLDGTSHQMTRNGADYTLTFGEYDLYGTASKCGSSISYQISGDETWMTTQESNN